MRDRRALLKGLVSLPLLGGGLRLVGQPAAPVPLIHAAALPDLGGAQERARYCWAGFAAAMDEITASAAGWRVIGGGRIGPLSCFEGVDFLRVAEVSFDVDRDPRLKRPLLIERHREVTL